MLSTEQAIVSTCATPGIRDPYQPLRLGNGKQILVLEAHVGVRSTFRASHLRKGISRVSDAHHIRRLTSRNSTAREKNLVAILKDRESGGGQTERHPSGGIEERKERSLAGLQDHEIRRRPGGDTESPSQSQPRKGGNLFPSTPLRQIRSKVRARPCQPPSGSRHRQAGTPDVRPTAARIRRSPR